MALTIYPWQTELARELNNLRERMPNGVLVHGPRGIGTFDLVLAFAKSLLCTNPGLEGVPCGQCKGCRLLAAGNHPDIRYIVSEAESLPREIPFTPPESASSDRKTFYREILIHQTRAMGDFLNLMSNEGGKRVVVVYPADMIRPEAAASLLKNLEEPPEDTVFLLVADEIDKVLATIRSRCRLVRARAPSHEEALAWLEGKGVAEAERRLTEAGGMPLAVFDEDPRFSLDTEAREKLLAFLAKGRNGNPTRAIDAVGRDMTLSAASIFLSRWGWDLAAAKVGAPVRYFPQHAEAIAAIAQAAQPAGLYTWINSVRDVRYVSEHPLNAKTVIEALLLSYLRQI